MKKDTVVYEDFNKVDIRVGEVLEAKAVEKSQKLIQLSVDLGEDYGTVSILTGLLEYYKPEEFVGKKYCFIANLEPRKMMGLQSQGMLMVVDYEQKPLLIELDKNSVNGTIVR